MRKRLLAIGICLLMLAMLGIIGIAKAETSASPTSPANDLAFGDINVGGDTFYFPMTGEFRVGIGSTVATYKEYLELRVSLIPSTNSNNDTRMGVGISVNIPKAIERAGGTWMLKGIKSSIGVSVLKNFVGPGGFEPAIVLNVIKVEF